MDPLVAILENHPIVLTKENTRKPKEFTNFVTTLYPLLRGLLTQTSFTDIEATCYTQASKGPDWQVAMTDEVNALLQNKTWQLIPARSNVNLVDYKWPVFGIKRKADGPIECYKTRIMARGL